MCFGRSSRISKVFLLPVSSVPFAGLLVRSVSNVILMRSLPMVVVPGVVKTKRHVLTVFDWKFERSSQLKRLACISFSAVLSKNWCWPGWNVKVTWANGSKKGFKQLEHFQMFERHVLRAQCPFCQNSFRNEWELKHCSHIGPSRQWQIEHNKPAGRWMKRQHGAYWCPFLGTIHLTVTGMCQWLNKLITLSLLLDSQIEDLDDNPLVKRFLMPITLMKIV